MPTPRRPISSLAIDAAGTLPVAVPRIARLERYAHETRRCATRGCGCILARDNREPLCSPCQRRLAGVPDHVSLYLPERPGSR